MDLFGDFEGRVQQSTRLRDVPDQILRQYIPEPKYDYYWDRLNIDPDSKLNLRKRFRTAYNKFYKGSINSKQFEKRLDVVSEQLDTLLGQDVVEFDAGEDNLQDNGDFELNLPEESIELADLSETTPLLEGAVDVGTAAAGVGEVAASSGTTATVLGGLGAGVIGATAGAAIYNKVTSSGATIPGTKYIGPGNPLDNGDPVSNADEDARQHDIAYSKGGDVSEPDQLAINQFTDHFVDNPLDIPALAGSIGLRTKQFVEKKTGQIYPSVAGKWLLLNLMLITVLILIHNGIKYLVVNNYTYGLIGIV